MTELNDKTLAQIVTNNQRAAAVFEKHHLDFCCKGKRTLQQACVEQNIPVDILKIELNAISGNSPANGQWAFPLDKLTLAQLVDHIVSTHHAYVKNEMGPLNSYLQKVVLKHKGRHPELVKIAELFAALKEEMEMHMKKEEQVLFPRIKEIEKYALENQQPVQPDISYLQSPVSMMESEHEHAGALLQEIRQLTSNYTPPQDACTTYKLSFALLNTFELDLHQHVHLENNILFPKAIVLFKSLRETELN